MRVCIQQKNEVHVVYEMDQLGSETGTLTESACQQSREHATELRRRSLLARRWYRIVLHDDEGRLLDERVEMR